MKKLLYWTISLCIVLTTTSCSGNPGASTSEVSGPKQNTNSSIVTSDKSTGYPQKAIQVVLPVKAGGDTDYNMRAMASYMEKYLGVPIVVTNVEGGSGVIGMKQVVDAEPDGYTVLFHNSEIMLPKMAGLSEIGIDDFEIAGIAIQDRTTVLAVRSDFEYQELPVLIEQIKAEPRSVEFGMATGGVPHLVGVAMEQDWDIDLKMVDIGGNAAKITALLGGQTDFINTTYGTTSDYFANGDFTCLGLLSAQRNPLLPEVPTTAELGYPLDFSKFFLFAFPKGTPQEIVDTFSAAMEKCAADADWQSDMAERYLEVTYMDSKDATDYAKKYYEDNLLVYQDAFLAETSK